MSAGHLALAALFFVPALARAEHTLSFHSSLKATQLVSRARSSRDVAGASLWRLRLEPHYSSGETLSALAAYEQKLSLASAHLDSTSTALLLSTPSATLPFRVEPLSGPLASEQNLSWVHELDRLQAAWHLSFAELTVGRQAVGWGRGAIFGAADVFAPFAPLEVDREWRAGVDAARGDFRLGPHASVEAVGAFGPRLDESAFAARVRGFGGNIDAELLGGRRFRDYLFGGTSSVALAGAELHLELVFFHLPSPWPDAGLFGSSRWAPKALLGGSYSFPVGSGLRALLEYQYSGFGLTDIHALPDRLADAAFRERAERGDFQTWGRHGLAASLGYDLSLTASLALAALVDPADGSGLVAPSLTWDLGENASLLFSLYAPWGRAPQGGLPESQFGAVPVTGLVQLRLYDGRPVFSSAGGGKGDGASFR